MSHTIYKVSLASISPYGQSSPISTPKERQETADDHENRAWTDRIHAGKDGEVFIPPMAFKFALTSAAKGIGLKIPGKKGATYTKVFEAGLIIADPVMIGVKKDDVVRERLFLNSDGIRGSGKRVWRNMPRIDSWSGDVYVHVLNDLITRDILSEHFEYAGMYVGVGFFRPERGGYWGRFKVTSVQATNGK